MAPRTARGDSSGKWERGDRVSSPGLRADGSGSGSGRRLHVFREPRPNLLGHGDGREGSLLHADEHVASGRHQRSGFRLPPDFEVEAHGRPADPAEVRLDDEELVELDGPPEIAFDANPGQPDAENLEKKFVVQPRGPEQLRFREAEEPQIGLVLDDLGGVDVLPPNVFFDAIARQRSSRGRGPLEMSARWKWYRVGCRREGFSDKFWGCS